MKTSQRKFYFVLLIVNIAIIIFGILGYPKIPALVAIVFGLVSGGICTYKLFIEQPK